MISITQYIEEGKGLRLKTRIKAAKRKLKRITPGYRRHMAEKATESSFQQFTKDVGKKYGVAGNYVDRLNVPPTAQEIIAKHLIKDIKQKAPEMIKKQKE